tara:strand:+ start:799 stop:1131 length:333 start_codon:yes stop_codon:yes gene_type:complete
MKLLYYLLISSLSGTFLFLSGCSKEEKWKALPLNIKKRESFNYSEMISGELDSTEKADLEAVKKFTTKEMKESSNQLNQETKKYDPRDNSNRSTIWVKIKKMFNRFLELF